MLVSVALTGFGCSSDPDPTKPQAKSALQVEASTCLLVDDTLGAEVETLPVIGCSLPHTHEIFAKITFTNGPGQASDVFPGMGALEAFAERECFGLFEGFVGVNPFDSVLFISWIVPSLDSWSRQDDHQVLCVLGRRDAGQLDRSAKESNL